MKVRLGHAVLALASISAMLFAVGTSSASAAGLSCKPIKGVGSSLQLVLQTEVWGPSHWTTSKGAEECETVQNVTYEATSSGKGKEQWGDKNETLKEYTKAEGKTENPLAAFIGSDTAASTAQMEKMSKAGDQAVATEGIVSVPVVQSAITVMVSLPEGCEPETGAEKPQIGHLVLSKAWEKDEETFTQLLPGKQIKESTAGSKKCEVDPTLHGRGSNSGTTAGFKRYFKVLEPTNKEWEKVTETLTKAEEPLWPEPTNKTIVKTAKTGQELVKQVFATAGTMGYADLPDAAGTAAEEKFEVKWVKHGVIWSAIAVIETAAATFKSPELAGGASNCEAAEYKAPPSGIEVKQGVNWSESWRKNVLAIADYPICTLTFDLAWHSYETTSLEGTEGYESTVKAEETAHTVLSYLKWDVGETKGQAIATLASKHYGKLPEAIDIAAESGVKKTHIG
jgi:hypothetical protein